jgi:hypothetical protein
LFWTTTSALGDGAAAYSQTDLFLFFTRMFLGDQTKQGVINGYLASLSISGATTSPLTLNNGGAIVAGIPYLNDANKSLAVTSPSVGTTGFSVVLQADYTAQTVRAVIKKNTDGTAAAPALTQTGSVWEISLYDYTITTGGVITLTANNRKFLYPPLVSYYNTSGVLTDATKMQVGTSACPAGNTTITFASLYPTGTVPTVVATVSVNSTYNMSNIFITAITNTGFTVNNNSPVSLNLSWMAFAKS